MRERVRITLGRLAWAVALLATLAAAAYAQAGATDSRLTAATTGGATQAAVTTSSVKGSGTPGRLPKWVGGVNPSVDVGDSIITESGAGQIGIGTGAPTSKLTVAGTVEATAGGFKFPDGTLQTTAGLAPGQAVRSLNGLAGDVTLAAGSGIAITPTGNTLTIASTAPDPAKNAYAAHVSFQTDPNDYGAGSASIPVPAGKRFVIQYMSIRVFRDGECQPMKVTTTLNGVGTEYYVQLPNDKNGFSISVDRQVLMYADSALNFSVISRSGADDKAIDITLTGYLVDKP